MNLAEGKNSQKAKIINASIEIYLLSHPKLVTIDKDGNEHEKPYRLSHLARELEVSYRTLYRWRTTGNIAPFYKKELMRRGILNEEGL